MDAAAWASLFRGAAVTLAYSLAGIVLGVALGLVLALLRRSHNPLLTYPLATYVSVVRATPLITLCLAVSLGFPALGWDISTPVAAIVALTVNTSSFNSEIWRAGLNSFPTEQLDAARAFGFNSAGRLRYIVLPQVVRSVLPNLVNEMTVVFKASPAIAILGIVDITRAAVRIGAETFDPLPPLMAALLLYTALIAVLVGAQRSVERTLRMPQQ
jgi:polar amino acid transport system permease protein